MDSALEKMPTASSQLPVQASGEPAVEDLQTLAQEFTKWFYPMLHESSKNMEVAAANNYHSPHFYDDCHMKMLLVPQPEIRKEEQVIGDSNVCRMLFELVCKERLFFNPNLMDGTKAVREPHGLVVIHVCGTVHRDNQVKGMFEQQFGIIKDPFMGNNFRIKYTNLCIQGS